MQPQMQTVTVVDKTTRIVCPCGGKSLLVQGAFLVRVLIGKPEITPAFVITCNKCGEDIEPPFLTVASGKEAS